MYESANDHAEGDLVSLQRAVRPVRRRIRPVTLGMIVRLVIAAAAMAALSMLALPSLARAETMRLRGDVTARGDVLTVADLVENAPANLSARPLFRAPALGATGTIQARRIVEALERLELTSVETGGRPQIQVQRAARRIGPTEIEGAIKRALQASHGLDPANLSVRFDGETALLAPVDLDGQVNAVELTYDSRSHRVAGLIVLGERQASLRVAGQVLEMREVAVLTRSIGRGETLGASDVTLERRPREVLPPDALTQSREAVGQVAQRSLSAGGVLRMDDTAPPDLVRRGEAVAIVFETGGVSLTLTGIANETGRLGAVVTVTNPTSKKVLQGTVAGPGRVSVGPNRAPQPIAQASGLRPSGLN